MTIPTEQSKDSIPLILISAGKKQYQDLMDRMDDPLFLKQLHLKDIEEIQNVFALSPFIYGACIKKPWLFRDLWNSHDLIKTYTENEYKTRLIQQTKTAEDSDRFGKILKSFRQREMIRIAWRDLTRKSSLDETLQDLSALADACVIRASHFLTKEMTNLYGTPCDLQGRKQELLVIGMGKLGAGELNFSSDIDLIFTYRENGLTDHPENPVESQVFFTRLCHKFLKLFHNEGPSDMLFRVDTRLRPYGDSGPIVMDFDSMEEYYLRQGREWERYASIKARMITGNKKDNAILSEKLGSFVYRRYLDFAVYDSLRDMKGKIMFQVKQKGYEKNIKLGAGGIREIEFFGQIFQLIRGGVDPYLKRKKILDVLNILSQEGYVPEHVTRELSRAYVFLRMTENRIQEYRDMQTHDLPESDTAKAALFHAMGFDTWSAFEQELDDHMHKVHSHFNDLLSDKKEDTDEISLKEKLTALWKNSIRQEESYQILEETGFDDPETILNLLKALKADRNTLSLSTEGSKRLDKLIPVVLKKTGQCRKPSRVLSKVVDLIKTIERRTCYIALLLENPAALIRIIEFAEKSAWMISFLSRHPVLLDELIDIEKIKYPPGKQEMKDEIDHRLSKQDVFDPETILEEMCIFKQNIILRIAAADISGNLPLMKVSDSLTFLAETVLGTVLDLAWNQMKLKYGLPSFIPQDAGPRNFAIIAFGKLGGIELGYASDLDLIFLYSGETGQTGGKRSIDNMLFFTRLAQRMIHFLTVRSSTGILYEADMRLRPGGESGMIISHVDSYEDYYRQDAWTWEHQALVRARFICGDRSISEHFNQIRKKILSAKRNRKELQKDVLEMRDKIRAHKSEHHRDQFDIKQGPGGIVDIEFLVQYLVLHHAHHVDSVSIWSDNVRIMEALEKEKLISHKEAHTLKKAYLAYRKYVHRQSLEEKPAMAEHSQFKKASDEVTEIWNHHLKQHN